MAEVLGIVGKALHFILGFILLIVFLQAILSWLIAFEIIKTRNRGFWQLMDMLDRLTTPLLAPFRRFMPLIGGIDISPIALIFTIYLIGWIYDAIALRLIGLG